MTRRKPSPIIDNLEYIDDPFKQNNFDVERFFTISKKASKPLEQAETDYEYALKFLYAYNGSSATFNAYRREVERLLQWCWFVHGQAAITLKREDFENYVEFCISPPKSWIGFKNVARFKNKEDVRVCNPDWYPFVVSNKKLGNKKPNSNTDSNSNNKLNKNDYELSQRALKSTFAILSSFFNCLVQEQVVAANPILLILQKSKYIVKQQQTAPMRRISNLQWS